MKYLFSLITVLLFSSCSFPNNSQNTKPMYGNMPKTAAQIQADRNFVTTVVNSYGSKRAAAIEGLKRGYQDLDAGDLDQSMKRFNQAWLIDPDFADVYGAFAMVEGRKGNYTDAFNLLQMGLDKEPRNQRLLEIKKVLNSMANTRS